MNDAETLAPRRRAPIVAGAALILLLLAILLVWRSREPIARSYIDDALAARGVPARYRITDFGLSSQTLEDISIGDPARPDLTAKRAVVHESIGFGTVRVVRIEAEGVRLNGRLKHGRVMLGAIDRLLPPPTGAPFALPDIEVALDDARMRLETPMGAIGLHLEGAGNLSDGFIGKLAATMPRLDVGGCLALRPSIYVNLAVAEGKPSLDGPVRAQSVTCGAASTAIDAPRAALDLAFNERVDRWDGNLVLETGPARYGAMRADMLGGRIALNGTAARIGGPIVLFARGLTGDAGRAARLTLDGRYALQPAGGSGSLVGEAQISGGAASGQSLRALSRMAVSAEGTPVGPVARAIGEAIGRAGRAFDAQARLALVQGASGGAIRIERLDGGSASGAQVQLRGPAGDRPGGLTYYWPQGRARIDGNVALAGGGLPEARLSLRQARAGRPIRGEAAIAPYRAGDARLALAPISFSHDPLGGTRFTTRVTMDGPLGDGRVEGLSLPIEGRLGKGGRFLANPRCAPLDFARLRVAGMALGRTRLPLCPAGGAMLAGGPDGLSGGARIIGLRLAGRIGQSPLLITSRSLAVAIGQPGFIGDGVAVRLGSAPSLTRLDMARLNGRFADGGVTGRFAGAEGKIGAVPLILSEAMGDWQLRGGVLSLAGGLRLTDEAAPARFEPLISRDVRLTLKDGVIRATGQLREPRGGTAISGVTIVHDLSRGSGNALLDVPGIGFDKALQPEMLTRLTLGVIANVAGKVEGQGRIRWDGNGVSSDGDFSSGGLDLAAAFGPVKGIKGSIHFSDLLNLTTPPGQTVTIAEANPGVAVADGVLRYQLLEGQNVRIEGGRWPFSGGELLLDPALMDFGRPVARRMTVRVVGMDAAKFVEQFEFRNIAVTGTFDGVLPLSFDQTGGRIEGGRLVVRRGGGTLAYVGEVSNASLGMFGRLAFDALKRMRYDSLAIELDGALDGEIVSRVLFDGTNEAPKEAKKGLLSRFTNLPFRFRITIRAPFRGLLNSAQSLNDPRGLIRQALPKKEAPLPGSAPIQPQASENKQ
ncbi:YdbH domain-containing protein [Sphingomonas oleivorans]|nr:YdbH domain-containing protein [Sphingomonas oleivorans]